VPCGITQCPLPLGRGDIPVFMHSSIVRNFCSLQIDDKRFGVAKFMRESTSLRDTVAQNFDCYALLPKNENSCTVNYLATVQPL